ncbi:hypothetical protein NIES4073_37710 [Kalymmatonema gypsitolerans NIES-4073]|nr:hypothetical protein NIES4073_37710 [Scytonema sp. NIES-4073]
MTTLFEITSLNDYSIAEFTVATIYLEKWVNEITNKYDNIELPIGESSIFRYEVSQDRSCYKMRYLNNFDVCWQIFCNYRQWYEEVKFLRRDLENFIRSSEKRMRMSEDDYWHHLEMSTINSYDRNEYLLASSHKHISYEHYISSYE